MNAHGNHYSSLGYKKTEKGKLSDVHDVEMPEEHNTFEDVEMPEEHNAVQEQDSTQSSQISIKQSASNKRRRLVSSSDLNGSFDRQINGKRSHVNVERLHEDAQSSKTVSNVALSKRDTSKRSYIDHVNSSDIVGKRHSNKRQRHVISSDDSDDDLVQSTQDLERELKLLKVSSFLTFQTIK